MVFWFDAMSTGGIKLANMKATGYFVLLLIVLLGSCASQSSPPPADLVESEPVRVEAVEETAEVAVQDDFEVSEEVYRQTFEEIEDFIEELSSVISKKQFDKWLGYLSRPYIRIYNSPEQLDEISQYRQLKDNGIYLKTIRDYFDWVVVPSRSKATLNEIVFVGENEVIAYSSFEGKRAKLYELERIGEEWKVTVW